jgi:transposase
MRKLAHIVLEESMVKISNDRHNWKRSRLSPQEVSELVDRYRNGESHGQLVNGFGITKTTVSWRLQHLRIEKYNHVRRKLGKEDFYKTIVPRYQNDESIASLTREHHIDSTTLRTRFIHNTKRELLHDQTNNF